MRSLNPASQWFSGLFALALCFFSINEAGAQILWYNGDDNGVDSYLSTASSTPYSGVVYDDFTVTSSGGVLVTGVFGNFLDLGTVTDATWTILSGVSAGNPGTLVATGTSAATVTSSLDSFNNTLYNVSVSGLSLTLAPGTYWLGLQPITSSMGFLVTTSGANAIGTPPGNDGNAFATDSAGDFFISATTTNTTTDITTLDDFSMGIDGSAVVPEPSCWALVLLGVGCIAFFRARSKRV